MPVYNGTANADSLRGSAAADTINGLAGDDTIQGGGGNDFLTGGAGNDSLDGQQATAVFSGKLSDYTITWDFRTFTILDSVTGRDGFDQASVKFLKFADVTVDIWHFQSPSIFGTSGKDILAGTALADRMWGLAGNDSLSGKGGFDDIDGGEGNDTLRGDAGNDTLAGSWGNDRLYGGDGDDLLDGDFFLGPSGNDYIDGGAGNDAVGYGNAQGPLALDLATGLVTGADGNDTLVAVESATGGNHDDSLAGDGNANELYGFDGNDTIRGQGGPDLLDGWAGDDVLEGGEGNDTLSGGDGMDTASYAGATSGVVVHLGYGTASGGAGNDAFTSIENAIGSAFDDDLATFGFSAALWGASGNDTLFGGGPGSVLDGGEGDDHLGSAGSLYGGAGHDTLAGGSTMMGGAGNDTISEVGEAANVDGGPGIDTVHVAAAYGARQLPVLTGCERLVFTDVAIVFDVEGHADEAIRMVAAALGPAALQIPGLMTIALAYVDAGVTGLPLAQVAADALYAHVPDDEFVAALFHNITGVVASPEQTAHFTSWLDSGAYTRASLLQAAASPSVIDPAIGMPEILLAGQFTYPA